MKIYKLILFLIFTSISNVSFAYTYVVCEGKGLFIVDESVDFLNMTDPTYKEDFEHQFEVFFDKKNIKLKSDIFPDREINIGWTEPSYGNYSEVTTVYDYSEEEIHYSYFDSLSDYNRGKEHLTINRRDGSFTFKSMYFLRNNDRTRSFWWEDRFGQNMDAFYEIKGKCRSQKRAF